MPQEDFIASVFRKEVIAMSAYKVADASDLIKLDAMENPYNWPENINQQWLAALSHCPLNRYPDPGAKQLNETIRLSLPISSQSEILLGNGSDEIIQILLQSLHADATVLAPDPSFVMYRQIALSLGLDYQSVPLQADDFALDLPAMLSNIGRFQPALIFLSYPNNPSGNLFPEDAIIEIIEKAPGLVILDEAYAPFASASFMSQLDHYANLLVMRTVSKLGLAGLRLGYLCGDAAIIQQLDKVRLPYNINTLTQISAKFALKNSALFASQTAKICSERQLVFQQLKTMKWLTVYPSKTNFILFRTEKIPADEVFNSLKLQGVLIKNLSPQGGQLQNCLRVTIGKPGENKQFITALSNCL